MATPFLPAGATTGDSGGELSSGDNSGEMEFPQTEASRSLAQQFEKAAAHVQGLIQVASREQLLYLYARYKQGGETFALSQSTDTVLQNTGCPVYRECKDEGTT